MSTKNCNSDARASECDLRLAASSTSLLKESSIAHLRQKARDHQSQFNSFVNVNHNHHLTNHLPVHLKNNSFDLENDESHKVIKNGDNNDHCQLINESTKKDNHHTHCDVDVDDDESNHKSDITVDSDDENIDIDMSVDDHEDENIDKHFSAKLQHIKCAQSASSASSSSAASSCSSFSGKPSSNQCKSGALSSFKQATVDASESSNDSQKLN